MTYLESLEPIKPYLVDELPLLKKAYTVQILLLRQTHDLSIFRTEATGELNIATLPHSPSDRTPEIKIVMYGSKQKAPETRKYVNLVRTQAQDHEVELNDDQVNCALKDMLCMGCPRCVLFGAVQLKGDKYNIKHRIEYNSAYSLENYEDHAEVITFNAVETPTQSTGQALGKTENATPLVNFPSVVTLSAVTEKELIMYLKTLLACKSYGAETRVKGKMNNYILGIVGGYEELITPLELNLEMNAKSWDDAPRSTVEKILEEYKRYAAFRKRIQILGRDETEKLLEEVRNFEITRDFIAEMYEESAGIQDRIDDWEEKKD